MNYNNNNYYVARGRGRGAKWNNGGRKNSGGKTTEKLSNLRREYAKLRGEVNSLSLSNQVHLANAAKNAVITKSATTPKESVAGTSGVTTVLPLLPKRLTKGKTKSALPEETLRESE